VVLFWIPCHADIGVNDAADVARLSLSKLPSYLFVLDFDFRTPVTVYFGKMAKHLGS